MWRKLAYLMFAMAVVALPLLLVSGCAEKLPTEGEAQAPDQVSEEGFDFPGPVDQSLGAWTSIAWPFQGDHPNNWKNWNNENYPVGGSMGHYCNNQYIHTHSGADHYARDLSRKHGGTANRPVYAGLSGKIVFVGPYGPGMSVVIYYPSQRLCIRYAHLGEVAVHVGQHVSIRQYIGKIKDMGNNSHLHLVAYENVPEGQNGYPGDIPNLCDRTNLYSCRVFFFS